MLQIELLAVAWWFEAENSVCTCRLQASYVASGGSKAQDATVVASPVHKLQISDNVHTFITSNV